MGEPVAVVTRLGSTMTVDSDEAPALLESGDYRLAAPEEAQAFSRQEQYGGALDTFGASLAGAARGATFGASDVILTELGGEGVRDTLQAYREVSPLASIGGEVVGSFIGPAKGATGLAGRLGKAAGGGLKGATLAAAAEGAMFGAGQGVTALALDDTPVTGERIAAVMSEQIASGAAMGGGFGLGFGLAGKATGAMARGIGKAFGHAGDNVPSAVRDLIANASSAVSGKSADDIASLLASKEGRRMAVHAADELAAKTDDLHAALTRAKSIEHLAEGNFRGALKRQQVAKLIRTGNEAQTLTHARGVMAEIRGGIGAMLEEGGTYAKPSWLKNIGKRVDDMEARFARAEQAGSRELNTDLLMEFDNLKRFVGQKAMKLARKRGRDAAETATWHKLKGLYDDTLRPMLESEKLWGDAGKMQRALNEPWSRLLNAKRGQRAANAPGSDKLLMGSASTWDGIEDFVDKEKVKGFLASLTDPAKDKNAAAVREWMRTSQDFVDAAKQHLDLSPADQKAMAQLGDHMASLRTTMDEAEKVATYHNQLKRIDEADAASGLMTGAAGYAIGSGILGPAAGVAAGSLSVLSRPGGAIRKMVALESMLSRYEGAMGGRVRKLLKGGKATALRGAVTSDELRQPPRKQRYEARVQELRQVAANPDRAREKMAAQLAPLAESAPVATQAATEQYVRAQTWLAAQLPKERTSVGLKRQRPPSQTEQDRFERLDRAVADPVGAMVDGLEQNRLPRDVVQAVQATWPGVYEDMRNQLLEGVADAAQRGEEIPYARLVAISRAFDIALDPTVEPEVMNLLQSSYAPAADAAMQQDTSQGSKPVGSGYKPGLATEYKTEAERLAEGRS